MILLADIGNSTVVIAITDNQGTILHNWRFKTQKDTTASAIRTEISAGISHCSIPVQDVQQVVVSSVVPELNDVFSEAVTDLTGIQPHFFSVDDAQQVMGIDVDTPALVGKDRLADAAGAVSFYGEPAIVFDFGTATTVGVVNEDKCFIGGMIIPGVKTSLHALSSKASQLPEIDIEGPLHIVGRNTLECMQSGILYGTAAMVDGLIDRLSTEFTKPFNVIATGGMSRKIVPFCRHQIIIDEFLQLKGLLAACTKISKMGCSIN